MCKIPKVSTTTLEFTDTNKYLIIRLFRRNNLKITNLQSTNQIIGNSNWKLIATMEHIPGGVGHYCAWVKMESNCNKWIRLNDNLIKKKRFLNNGLLQYNLLLQGA